LFSSRTEFINSHEHRAPGFPDAGDGIIWTPSLMFAHESTFNPICLAITFTQLNETIARSEI